MKLSLSKAVGMSVACFVAAASIAVAQIERLDLPTMISRADNAVIGEIVDVREVATEGEHNGLLFTEIHIQGRSLVNGEPIDIRLATPSGSEAPVADDLSLGNRVVAFYKWEPNMGNGYQGYGLYASHGGLYRVQTHRGKDVVLGRGEGYALSSNWKLPELDQEITTLAQQK